MKADFKCFMGLHHYEVLKEEPLTIAGGDAVIDAVIGKVIVSRCSNCGKIKTTTVRPIDRLF